MASYLIHKNVDKAGLGVIFHLNQVKWLDKLFGLPEPSLEIVQAFFFSISLSHTTHSPELN